MAMRLLTNEFKLIWRKYSAYQNDVSSKRTMFLSQNATFVLTLFGIFITLNTQQAVQMHTIAPCYSVALSLSCLKDTEMATHIS